MIWLVLIVSLLLVAVVALATVVQTFYMESQRLRARDLPSLEFFKETLEERLEFKTEDGALRYSLVKYTVLPLLSMIVLAPAVLNAPLTLAAFVQAFIFSWLLTMLCVYVIPQILYRRTSGHWLLPLIPVCLFLALLMKPLAALFGFLQSLFEIANQPAIAEEAATPAENIEALITAGTEEGLIEEEDRKLIQNVVEFGDTVVREIMTPRPDVVAIDADVPLEQLRQLVINEQYSRIPVFEKTIDNIIGFVHVRDMFELDEDERLTRTVRELMRPIRFVPETKMVKELMREMQQEGAHMVIVIDEYGNTAGIATMEDLVEVILGEIRDEHEPQSDVTEDGRGGYIVSGNFDLARVSELFGVGPEAEVDSTTIGGMVSELLGRVPSSGEELVRDGLRIEVLASDELRVEQVRLSKAVTPEPRGPETGDAPEK